MNVITKTACYEQNISKSRFIGFSYIVYSEQEAQQYIKQIQNKYCDCRHVVYAYKIHPNIEKKGNSSEPAGTAGAPIFACIEKHNLSNVLVVIVRYFGGVLLGANNLYRAYSSTANQVLLDSGIKEIKKYNVCEISCSYAEYNELKAFSEKYNTLIILGVNFFTDVVVKVAFQDKHPLKLLENLIQKNNAKVGELWL